jgi:hypothetical protein
VTFFFTFIEYVLGTPESMAERISSKRQHMIILKKKVNIEECHVGRITFRFKEKHFDSMKIFKNLGKIL